MENSTSNQLNDQYSLIKILGIWVAAAVPMPILSFVIGPAIAARIDVELGLVRWFAIIVGLIWLFCLAMIVLYCELGTLRWPALRKRMWYQTPIDPKTGEPNAKLLWWAVPAVVLNALVAFSPIDALLDKLFFAVFPFFKPLALSASADLGTPEFVGQWWLLGVVLVSNLFNHFLGEEWLFRGTLLPKLKGVFGRWDWLANMVLFAAYHWHQPWDWMTIMLAYSFAVWASRRFKCNWIMIITHGADGVFLLFLVLAVVTGLAF